MSMLLHAYTYRSIDINMFWAQSLQILLITCFLVSIKVTECTVLYNEHNYWLFYSPWHLQTFFFGLLGHHAGATFEQCQFMYTGTHTSQLIAFRPIHYVVHWQVLLVSFKVRQKFIHKLQNKNSREKVTIGSKYCLHRSRSRKYKPCYASEVSTHWSVVGERQPACSKEYFHNIF